MLTQQYVGCVRLGIPDEQHPEFTHFFIEGYVQYLTEVVADPDRLKVSADSVLHLRILIVSNPL